jgi:hypothetical protein
MRQFQGEEHLLQLGSPFAQRSRFIEANFAGVRPDAQSSGPAMPSPNCLDNVWWDQRFRVFSSVCTPIL